MSIVALTLLVVLGGAQPTVAAEPVARVVSAPIDKVWSTTEALLAQFGWSIDRADRSIGWITTKSRALEGGDFGVYAKGIRHRLRIHVRANGEQHSTVSVERIIFKRERILWMDKDEPAQPSDLTVEREFLAALEKSL